MALEERIKETVGEMRVLLTSLYFYPEKVGISVTATDCAKFIADFGHEVSVICGMPFYPEWKIHRDYENRLWTTEKLENISLKRVWLYVPQKPSPIKRILHEAVFSFLVLLRSIIQRFDLLLCISPPLTLGFISVLVAMVKRKKHWFFVKDIQPDAAVDLGMIRNKKLIKLMFWVEKFIYAHSEKIIVLSEGMARNLMAKGVPREKVLIIPDSIDVRELASRKNGVGKFRRRYALDDRFLVLYSGNIGVKQNPAIIVECAKLLKDNPVIFFAVVGEGAMKEPVQELIDKYGLSNIRIFPLCERFELGDMLASADVLLAPQRREVKDIVVPSKLLAYFASKRPVLAAAHPSSEVAKIINENRVGIVVAPEDVEAMANGILSLKMDKNKADEIGERAYQFLSSTFSHEIVKEKFYKPLFDPSYPDRENHEGSLSEEVLSCSVEMEKPSSPAVRVRKIRLLSS
jgi:colanic acid biosynthesis glycosyl transferase WcaI